MSKLEKWQAEAAAQGWTFVAQATRHYGVCVHDKCGQAQQIALHNMRNGNVRCKYCQEQTWRNDATTQGWTFVLQIDGVHSTYVHDVCGHEQKVKPSLLKARKVRCKHCQTQTWVNAATAQGWIFENSTGGGYASYIHSCGHKQQLVISAMRTGEVACHGCGESWATKPSNLYMLDITTACGQRFLKLGIARIVERRAARYGLAEGAKVKVLYAKAFATGAEAHKIEKQLHKSATSIPYVKRFKGAKKLMDCGYTECYEYSPEAAGHLLLNLLH